MKAEQLLVPPQLLATLDYDVIEQANVQGEVHWTAQREGTAHGVLVWFDTELTEGIGFSNAPGQPELIYGQAFFPLQLPVELAVGDEITIQLRADLTGDDYTWQWRTTVHSGGEEPEVKAAFRQSTFFGSPLTPSTLRKRANSYQPALDESGQVERFMLSLMDGRSTLGEIAQRVLQEFPLRFSGFGEALARVGDLSVKRSR